MASAKKKQDEKNLKALRELVSQSGNKECFDCQQRGPTYVNMTIGSFICTKCSGMLRGLTPPHRVKSISMATFTQEEINFLKERGNDYCRGIWLGLITQNAMPTQANCKDEQKMKDFMSAKYELKRYYLDPSMASQLSNNQKSQQQNKLQSNNTVKNSTNTLKAPPSKSSSSFKVKEPELISNLNNIDFVADFSKVPDPCPLNLPKLSTVPQPSFANFDNNPIFNNSTVSSSVNQLSPLTFVNANGTMSSPPPSEDRYAALKDLDSLMKQVNLKDESNLSWNIKETNNISNGSWSAFEQNSPTFISNPFMVPDVWQPNVLNNNHNNNANNNFQNADPFSYNSANPFRQAEVSTFNNDFHWFGNDSQNLENTPSSHLSTLTNKSWQPNLSGFKANPFVIGSGVGDLTRNSNNPFL